MGGQHVLVVALADVRGLEEDLDGECAPESLVRVTKCPSSLEVGSQVFWSGRVAPCIRCGWSPCWGCWVSVLLPTWPQVQPELLSDGEPWSGLSLTCACVRSPWCCVHFLLVLTVFKGEVCIWQ